MVIYDVKVKRGTWVLRGKVVENEATSEEELRKLCVLCTILNMAKNSFPEYLISNLSSDSDSRMKMTLQMNPNYPTTKLCSPCY